MRKRQGTDVCCRVQDRTDEVGDGKERWGGKTEGKEQEGGSLGIWKKRERRH